MNRFFTSRGNTYVYHNKVKQHRLYNIQIQKQSKLGSGGFK